MENYANTNAPKVPERLSLPEFLALARSHGKRLTYRAVYLAAIEGDLPAKKVGGKYEVERQAAESYLKQL